MKKIPVGKFWKLGKAFLVKHSADILTGFTACGVVLTAVETHKATLKAEEYLRVNGYSQANPDTQKVLKWQSRKNYILPAIIGGGTIGAALGANFINHKQIAGLAAACTVAETALTEHREKIEELMGEKALAKIDDEMLKDQGDAIMAANPEIIDTGHGDMICIEGLTGQVVRSCPDWFYTVRNRFNYILNSSPTGASAGEYLDLFYADCKGPFYIPEEQYDVGYNAGITGLFEFINPHWEGDADSEGYVIFKPTKRPIANYMDIY